MIMSKALKELKRIRQETAPNTYMRDFDKNKSCDVIEQELMASDLLAEKPLLCVHDICFHKDAKSLNEYIRYMYGYDCKCVVTDDEFALLKKVYGDR